MADIFELFKKISTSSSSSNTPVKFLVAGLGNPGKEYEHTRHNAGFLSIDYIAVQKGIKTDRVRFNALTATCEIAGVGVLLIKPQTFMNLSGKAVAEAARFYKIAPENIIVISDDTSFEVGKLRVRRNGSAGGHNGLKSINECIGNEAYPRIKVGVGKKPHPEYDLADWVLSNFTSDELKKLDEIYPKVLSGVEKIILGDVEGAMQICNAK